MPTASPPSLTDLQERFVLHWGEMAVVWGINRTMGQIHALLYVSPEPLTADEIVGRLRISRGNASMNLRALEDWGLIQRVHLTGERRERFRTQTDVWELTQTVVRERKRREFDPLLRTLRGLLLEAASEMETPEADPAVAEFAERVRSLVDLLDLMDRFCEATLPRRQDELPRLLEIEVAGLP